jgi:hypothetical protein
MLKYLPALFIVASQIPVTAIAQQSQCSNFWVNPKTGREECFGVNSNTSSTTDGYKFLSYDSEDNSVFIKKMGNDNVDGYIYPGVVIKTVRQNKAIRLVGLSVDCGLKQMTIAYDSNSPELPENPYPVFVGKKGSIGYSIWVEACGIRESQRRKK